MSVGLFTKGKIHKETSYNLATSLYSQGKYDEAETICKGLLEVYPEFHEAGKILSDISRIAQQGREEALSSRIVKRRMNIMQVNNSA